MSVMPGAGARPPRGQREDRAGLIAWGVPWGGEGDSSPRGRDLGWGWPPPRVRALQERSRDGPGAPDIPIPHLPRPAVKARVGADPILQTSVHRGAHLLETDCARTPWVERAAARGRRTGREAGHGPSSSSSSSVFFFSFFFFFFFFSFNYYYYGASSFPATHLQSCSRRARDA